MPAFLNLDAASLPDDVRRRHAAFLAAAQQADGGFPNRGGRSDLYYSGFALRGLALLGALSEPIARAAGAFLVQHVTRKGTVPFSSNENWDSPPLAGPLSGADFFSLITGRLLVTLAAGVDPLAAADWDLRQAVADFFEPLRRTDGGYAKTSRGTSSTYQTFLAVLSGQLAGLPPEEPAAILRFLRSRQREDGGFVELDGVRSSGTNPTAAAVEVLSMLAAVDRPTGAAAAAFLRGMQTAEGGLRANARIATADLLSTFTGLVALEDLEEKGDCPLLPERPATNLRSVPVSARKGTVPFFPGGAIDTAAAGRFVRGLEQPDGGFRAAAWDTTADVEYTFYGLGCLALLAGRP
jgi:geranylgeranyl transferase type-2 subunit beta